MGTYEGVYEEGKRCGKFKVTSPDGLETEEEYKDDHVFWVYNILRNESKMETNILNDI